MKNNRTTKTLIITAAILLIGGTIAFAHGGWGYDGYDRHMSGYGGHMMGPGYGGGHMMGYGPGWGRNYGPSEGLSEEQAAKLEETQERFYNETKELRRKINDLGIDLRDEMAKESPDSGKLAKIQKALSQSQADFDQKAIQHRLEMRKLAPEGFRGRGYGRGFGPGGGYCWR
ncbi:MAG: periplasmic heavy metal sensor [Desulfobacteraceae bacterium]